MNDLYHDYLVCWEELMFFWFGLFVAVRVAFWRLVGFV